MPRGVGLRRRPKDPAPRGQSRSTTEQFDGSAFDVGQAEFPGGGEGLTQEFVNPLDVAGISTAERHPSPFQPGPGEPRRCANAFVGRRPGGEVAVGVPEQTQDRRERSEVVV
jgi:hypothetical protein